jgi:Gas vesicle synthesis protein GvpL/GvpF
MTHTELETDFLYMYGVILAEELQKLEVPTIMGIDQNPTTIKIFKNLAAIITPINAQKFSQQQIDLKLKDAEWLKEKAFHHHQCITIIHQNFTVLPMSFCTIFQNESNLESLLNDQYDVLLQKLTINKDKQEFNLKLFCNTEKALSYVLGHNTSVIDLRGKLASMPKGKQFLMKKKLEHLIASELEEEQSRWWQDINQQLKSVVTDANLRRNWGREVTERKDEMIVNCDFLIDENKSEQFLNKIEDIEKSLEELGCTFHVTGPWPPYHFSKMAKEIK